MLSTERFLIQLDQLTLLNQFLYCLSLADQIFSFPKKQTLLFSESNITGENI